MSKGLYKHFNTRAKTAKKNFKPKGLKIINYNEFTDLSEEKHEKVYLQSVEPQIVGDLELSKPSNPEKRVKLNEADGVEESSTLFDVKRIVKKAENSPVEGDLAAKCEKILS
jgi:hypothetical protein